ncbi:Rid family hydrolase [Bacillus sp. FJAT-29937]|uniref:RidA family protein n=1 Tax=Bacillus sp. FJAT-29937 TaxID=1720553 RepID=UPI0009EA9D10
MKDNSAAITLYDVVKVNLFIANIDNFEEINEIYVEYFSDHNPARTTVKVANFQKTLA